MSLAINVRNVENTMVVSLAGTAGGALLGPLRDPLTAALGDVGLVVLHLDDLTGLEPVALRELIIDVVERARGGKLRIAASQALAVEVLAQARVHHLVAVHRSVEDARIAHEGEAR